MLPKHDDTVQTTAVSHEIQDHQEHDGDEGRRHDVSRSNYTGSLLFNIGAFILPALYQTLSKLWVANTDSSLVVTTGSYTYMGVVSEVINEGLPRAAWNIIGDNILGLILSIIFAAASQQLANTIVPAEIRDVSITYVRMSAFSALSSAIETAVAAATRALDQPDVPLVISSAKFAINIILDMILISKFHVPGVTPTVNTQAATQLACGLAAAFAGLMYFLWTSERDRKPHRRQEETQRPTLYGLRILARPGLFTFAESAVRNTLYLWLISGIVAIGSDYATAWGVFSTIRWGLVMVPVQALEATSLTFVGHAWGAWRRGKGPSNHRPTATLGHLVSICHPAFVSCAVALAVEVPLRLFLSFYEARRFAFYISESTPVSLITEKMWKTIDWCYIFYALSTQLATILLSSRPRWYLYQSLVSNLLWVLPWAIVASHIGINADDAWTYHSIVFGGSLVFSFFDILVVDLLWARALCKGRMRLPPLI